MGLAVIGGVLAVKKGALAVIGGDLAVKKMIWCKKR